MRKWVDTSRVPNNVLDTFRKNYFGLGSSLSESLRMAMDAMPLADHDEEDDPYTVLRAYVINSKGLSGTTVEHKKFLVDLEEVLNELSFYRKVFSPVRHGNDVSIYKVPGTRDVRDVADSGGVRSEDSKSPEPDFG